MESYDSLEIAISDTSMSKAARAKVFRKLAKLRKQIFKDNQGWINEIEHKDECTLDEAKKMETLPYGRDVESFRVMMIALRISVKCKIPLKLPVEKIYYLLKDNKEASNLVYAYLDKWQKDKASEFLARFPVDYQTKVNCGQSFPCSPDATRLIMSFLIPREIAQVMLVNHYFYDLCNRPDMWTMYRYYLRESGFKPRQPSTKMGAKQFVLKFHSTWHCAYCDEIRSDGESAPYCTNPENKEHPGQYNTWECQYCHQKGFGGNPNRDKRVATFHKYGNNQWPTWETQRYACPGQKQLSEEEYYRQNSNGHYQWYYPLTCHDPNFRTKHWSCCQQHDGREEIAHYYAHQYTDYKYSYPMILGCRPGRCRKNKIPENVEEYRKLSGYDKRHYMI